MPCPCAPFVGGKRFANHSWLLLSYHIKLMFRKLSGHYHCSKCGWPLCGDRCRNTKIHQRECTLFQVFSYFFQVFSCTLFSGIFLHSILGIFLHSFSGIFSSRFKYFLTIPVHRSVVQRCRSPVLENRTGSMTPFYPFGFFSKSSGTRKCTDWWDLKSKLCWGWRWRCACWWTTRRTNRQPRSGSTTSWRSWSGSPGALPRTSLSTRSGLKSFNLLRDWISRNIGATF